MTSTLIRGAGCGTFAVGPVATSAPPPRFHFAIASSVPLAAAAPFDRQRLRSEEHTSELQSRGNLVCRVLLENTNRIVEGDKEFDDEASRNDKLGKVSDR